MSREAPTISAPTVSTEISTPVSFSPRFANEAAFNFNPSLGGTINIGSYTPEPAVAENSAPTIAMLDAVSTEQPSSELNERHLPNHQFSEITITHNLQEQIDSEFQAPAVSTYEKEVDAVQIETTIDRIQANAGLTGEEQTTWVEKFQTLLTEKTKTDATETAEFAPVFKLDDKAGREFAVAPTRADIDEETPDPPKRKEQEKIVTPTVKTAPKPTPEKGRIIRTQNDVEELGEEESEPLKKERLIRAPGETQIEIGQTGEQDKPAELEPKPENYATVHSFELVDTGTETQTEDNEEVLKVEADPVLQMDRGNVPLELPEDEVGEDDREEEVTPAETQEVIVEDIDGMWDLFEIKTTKQVRQETLEYRLKAASKIAQESAISKDPHKLIAGKVYEIDMPTLRDRTDIESGILEFPLLEKRAQTASTNVETPQHVQEAIQKIIEDDPPMETVVEVEYKGRIKRPDNVADTPEGFQQVNIGKGLTVDEKINALRSLHQKEAA